MGEYWSVDEARWVQWTPESDDADEATVPEPRAAGKPALEGRPAPRS